MAKRKLASIQKVIEVLPHPNADRLDLIRVLGWQLCCEKGLYKPGDNCVFCEIDSVLPQRPEFEFMRRVNFRVKTIRLRDCLSQGLSLPMSLLPPGDYNIGDDVTDLLGIIKYEPPDIMHLGDVAGALPGFIPTTDEFRIQAFPNALERHKGCFMEATEKLEGTSMTVYFHEDHVGVCGRRLEYKEDPIGNAMWAWVKKHELDKRLKKLGVSVAIQGEFIGPGIQGNYYQLNRHDFRVYDFFFIKESEYGLQRNHQDLADYFNVICVPTRFTSYIPATVDEAVAKASLNSVITPGKPIEGLVWRPLNEHRRDPELGRFSFKTINNNYLLNQQ